MLLNLLMVHKVTFKRCTAGRLRIFFFFHLFKNIHYMGNVYDFICICTCYFLVHVQKVSLAKHEEIL